jgi:hypothetical protein
MRHWSLLVVAALALSGASGQARADGRFECPVKPLEDAQSVSAKALIPAGTALDQISSVNTAIGTLRAQGMRPGLIVDNLIAAYCPYVASQSGMNDAVKTAQVSRFATRVAGIVYAPTQGDEIILSVAFPPSMVNTISARAHSRGVSPEVWIRDIVGAALK